MLFGDQHVRVYRETDGREGHDWEGASVLLLTTTGRRSGTPRTMPLLYGDVDGKHVIVASKGGAPSHPAWYLNIEANPDVEVQVREEVYRARARRADGAERDRIWSTMLEQWPAFDEYQAKTERQIPVLVLERV